jgi:formylglycine-generating enzyme required for sulfatase activity
MRTKTLVLLGVSLIIILGFSACSFPATGGGTETGREGVPVEPVASAVPAELVAPGGPTNTDGAETILVPGASFWMGSEPMEADAEENEQPRHQVTLADFYIYTHEVTNEMYARCVEAGDCIPVNALPGGPTSHYGDPAFAEYPVSGVDWLMARDYCDWANARLPTEAEWELASRGVESLRYPWGEEDPDCDRVNMLGCLVPPDTVEVGSYEWGNSPYEVWDMSGNVWEWVHDWYDADYYYFSPASNPLGPNTGERETKVVRGGGLYSEPTMMRSAARQPADPNRPYDDVGFRCVALSDLDLPGDYVPADPGHLRVPPDSLDGGGDHVEDYDPDPDWWVNIGRIGFGCPSAGDMTVSFPLTATGPATLTASMDGVPWACRIDPATELATCEGAVPDGYGGSGTVLMEWCIEVEGGGTTCGAWTLRLPNPDDCEPPGGRGEFSSRASCPERGLVIVNLEYEPPVDWDLVQLDGADVPWWRISETEIGCFVPERPWDDPYQLHLVGTDAEGDSHGWWPLVYLPRDCPVSVSIVGVFAECLEEHPMARLSYHSGILTLESVSADGVPLRCIGTAGSQICGDLPGDAGSPATVTLCFEGEPCQDRTLTVPACLATGTEIGFGIIPGCYPTLGPVVTISYSPAYQPLVSANADGSDLTCVADGPGTGLYMCHGIPGAPGSETNITFCLADGSCYSGPITVRDCEAEEEPSDAGFTLAGLGCHDETRIFFIVDTGLDWLVPGAGFAYHASDYDVDYACSVHPTIPGRLYCSGVRPETPLELQVCVQQDGAPMPTCGRFPGWPAEEATIPDCAPPPPPVEPHIPTCADYADADTCNAHGADGCKWAGYYCMEP